VWITSIARLRAGLHQCNRNDDVGASPFDRKLFKPEVAFREGVVARTIERNVAAEKFTPAIVSSKTSAMMGVRPAAQVSAAPGPRRLVRGPFRSNNRSVVA
jgi:hypothetical protein